jgi:myo-inositol-1(or 4)-monophosphatase
MPDKPRTRSEIVESMKEAARIGGASLAENFARLSALPIMEKGPSDFVSAADIESERLIVAHLNQKLPDVAVLGEEGAASPDAGNGLRIIIDPLDGTNNFLHGIPQFSASLALMEGEEVTAGVTYNPLSGEMFWAAAGEGAYLGERRLNGSRRNSLAHAVVGTCFPYNGKGDSDKAAREMAAIMPRVSGIRSPGSAALEIAYVAEGRFDGFWTSGAKLDLWDLAAGVIIAREAGCLATEIDGHGDPLQCRSLVVAPRQFHGHFIEIFRSACAGEARNAAAGVAELQ